MAGIKSTSSRCGVVIVAGGTGTRVRSPGKEPAKQYRLLGGRPVIARTLRPFLDHPEIDLVQVVVRPGTAGEFHNAVQPHPKLREPVDGGARRQDSVRLGLEALESFAPDHVLIHDAVRPFVSPEMIDSVLAALAVSTGAIPALPVTDSLRRVGPDGFVQEGVDREGLFAVQTPQGFRYREILAAHRRAAAEPEEFTDDAAVAQWAGVEVSIVEGAAANRKLTTMEDFAMAEAALAETRIGSGFDVHRFGPGDHVMICGIRVPHERTLVGHSDADVGLHALTDALLGALAAGDIGSHFPPTDPRWKGVSSDVFLAHARDLASQAGARIVNVDVTLICEAPKVGPHRDAMRSRIAEIMEISPQRVAVKATTSEGLGFTGRGEGIAAQASVAVKMPGGE